MVTHPGISSRRSPRYEIVLPVRFAVSAAHAGTVRLTVPAEPGRFGLPGDLIDLSRGGAAFMSGRFLPRMCALDLRIYGLDGATSAPLVSGRARVQRVTMTDCRPGYLIGVSFIDSDPVFRHDLDMLLSRLGNDEAVGEEDGR